MTEVLAASRRCAEPCFGAALDRDQLDPVVGVLRPGRLDGVHGCLLTLVSLACRGRRMVVGCRRGGPSSLVERLRGADPCTRPRPAIRCSSTSTHPMPL